MSYTTENKLSVYKASAGSGKTFRLTMEYLKLVLKNPKAYKHILAVTFTNKATAEMKGRIIKELNKLAKSENSDMRNMLCQETKLDSQVVTERAKQALSNILHDYSMFSVSTIDKFVQRVIHSLLWELGIHNKSELKLETDLYVSRAVDRLIDESNTNKKLYNHLSNMLTNRLNNEENHKIEDNIVKLGKELFKEQFRLLDNEKRQLIANTELLETIEEYNKKSIETFEKNVRQMAKELTNRMHDNGLNIEDFSNKKNGVAGFFSIKCIEKELKSFLEDKFITDTVLNCCKDSQKWVAQNNKNKNQIIKIIESELQPKLCELVNYIQTYLPQLSTHIAIQQNISTLRLVSGIRDKIKELLAEDNSALLADSGPMLREMVNDDSDTPFVYEKVGTRYNHIMLDEFQDTSEIQWDNFKPLLQNGLAEGHKSLVVGDVKQAIYRWRNSNWRILGNKIGEEFDINIENLDTNFRSRQHIVEFNNHVFSNINQKLIEWAGQQEEGLLSAKMREFVKPVFDNPTQHHKQGNTGGYVEVCRVNLKIENKKKSNDSEIEDRDYIGYLQNRLPKLVESIIQRGYKPGDIAMLVRKHDEGQTIAKILISSGINIVSADAMKLDASHAVRLCVAAMQYINDPKNTIAKGVIMKEAHMLSHPNNPTNDWSKVFDPDAFNSTHEDFLLAQRSRSLGQIFEAVVEHFGIDQQTHELPYIAKLHDEIINMPRDGVVSLERFIKWWNDVGQNTKLTLPDNDQAVNIITIHKSKGLEYPVVILPFGNIKVSPPYPPTIWTPINSPSEYEKYPLYLIKLLKYLKNSTLRDIYIEDNVQTMIDALNMLYVALTRPEHELYVILGITENTSENKQKEINHIGQFLWPIVEANQNMRIVPSDDEFSNAVTTYALGQQQPYTQPIIATETEWNISKYTVSKQPPPIATKLSTGTVFGNQKDTQTTEREKSINLGIIKHRIFSLLHTHSDLQKVLDEMHLDGSITANQRNEYQHEIATLLQHHPYSDWFSGNYKIITERNIIMPGGGTYRPDRVMLTETLAIVVDYKFGFQKEKYHKKYEKQVQQYMQLVAQIHQCPVEGYVWYVERNRLQKIILNENNKKHNQKAEIDRNGIKMLYPGMENIVDLLLDHNVPFSHEGEVELTDERGVVIASSQMIIDNPKIAIDPASESDREVFEQHGYNAISLSEFTINMIVKNK